MLSLPVIKNYQIQPFESVINDLLRIGYTTTIVCCFGHNHIEKFSFNMHDKSMRPVVCVINSAFTHSHTHSHTHTHACGRGRHARWCLDFGVQSLCQGGFLFTRDKNRQFFVNETPMVKLPQRIMLQPFLVQCVSVASRTDLLNQFQNKNSMNHLHTKTHINRALG